MTGKTKRKFTADFKLKVVLEVLKGKDTLASISKKYELHPNQITDWKKLFWEGATVVFEPGTKSDKPTQTQESDTALLYEQIGRLQMEVNFFKKKLTL